MVQEPADVTGDGLRFLDVVGHLLNDDGRGTGLAAFAVVLLPARGERSGARANHLR